MLAYHFILHTPVAPISTSPLPAALCPLYLCTHTHIYIYVCISLTRNTPPASASLPEGCPFISNSSRNQSEKGRPPRPCVFYFPFLPLIGVAAMSTSPHNITLCPMLPDHFLLHAKSLPGPTLRTPPMPEAGFRPLPSQARILICGHQMFNLSRLQRLERSDGIIDFSFSRFFYGAGTKEAQGKGPRFQKLISLIIFGGGSIGLFFHGSNC